jgi:hypothetical protein
MTASTTRTSTFTVTNVRYLASKVASDLRQMQRLYGPPSDDEINDYLAEVVILLTGGWLDEVSYGFWRNGQWIPPVLQYRVNSAGNLVDNRSGGVLAGMDVSGAYWYSYLKTTQSWMDLPPSERESIRNRIPISRVEAGEPQANGYWEANRQYSSAGVGLVRRTLRPL